MRVKRVNNFRHKSVLANSPPPTVKADSGSIITLIVPAINSLSRHESIRRPYLITHTLGLKKVLTGGGMLFMECCLECESNENQKRPLLSEGLSVGFVSDSGFRAICK